MNKERRTISYLPRIAAALLLIVFFCSEALCQDNTGIVPHYVLVQISSEKNRIEALEKAHAYKDIEIVKKDAAGVKAAMMRDFKEKFNFCPVYFYVDTNIGFVKARKFDGILFDTAGQMVTNVPLKPDSKDYLIAYWGLPTTQPHNMKVVKDSVSQYSKVGEPSGKGLIVCNYKLQQLTYFYQLGLFMFTLDKKKLKGRYYISKRFDIEYIPMASQFNNNIPYIYE